MYMRFRDAVDHLTDSVGSRGFGQSPGMRAMCAINYHWQFVSTGLPRITPSSLSVVCERGTNYFPRVTPRWKMARKPPLCMRFVPHGKQERRVLSTCRGFSRRRCIQQAG